MRFLRRLLIVVGALFLACGEGGQLMQPTRNEASISESRLSTVSVNYPLQYFAQRIGGARVEAEFLGPEDEDPAYWSPAPEVVVAFQRYDLILLNGAGYAKWVSRVTLPETKLVDTSIGFQDRLVPLDQGPVHSHGPEGEHSHTGYAFTTWLDPALAIEHARAVRDALAARCPDDSEAFDEALAQLESDLEGIARRWDAVVGLLGGQPVLFSHPVYQYPIRRWKLNAESVHWEPGEAPKEAQWRELEALLARHRASWMIWEDEPLPEVVDRLQALGVGSLVLRPNATEPAEGDLIQAWMADLAAIETALRAAT